MCADRARLLLLLLCAGAGTACHGGDLYQLELDCSTAGCRDAGWDARVGALGDAGHVAAGPHQQGSADARTATDASGSQTWPGLDAASRPTSDVDARARDTGSPGATLDTGAPSATLDTGAVDVDAADTGTVD